RPGNIERARILVGLHADEPNKSEISVAAKVGNDPVDADAGVGLVDGCYIDIDIGPEQLDPRRLGRNGVHGCERIGRHEVAIPADDVPVVIVVGGLDQQHAEAALCRGNRARSSGRLQRRLLARRLWLQTQGVAPPAVMPARLRLYPILTADAMPPHPTARTSASPSAAMRRTRLLGRPPPRTSGSRRGAIGAVAVQ